MTRLFRSLFACAAPLLLVIAGCGGGPSSNPSNGSLTISPATTTIDTNGQVQFTATLPDGSPATDVNWVVSTGTNDSTTFGQGSIDSTGLYYPPSALSKDSVQIQVQANLASNVYKSVTAVVTVTPGFIQFVTPENATLSNGGTVQLNSTLAEVGGGSVNWSLSTSPSGGSSPGSAGGAISNTSCQKSGKHQLLESLLHVLHCHLHGAVLRSDAGHLRLRYGCGQFGDHQLLQTAAEWRRSQYLAAR